MADVFQIVAGVVGCVDVGVRVYTALTKLASEARSAENTAKELSHKVDNLRHVIENVHGSLQSRIEPTNRPLSDEELRIWSRIRASMQRCERTLQQFEWELNGIHDRDRFERLRRTLLALRLREIHPTVGSFERSVDTHMVDVQINFWCLQTHANNVMAGMLETIIRGGDAYLLQRSQLSLSSQSQREVLHETQGPSNVNHTMDSGSATDKDEIQNLENLRETLGVARSVVDRIPRQSSPRGDRPRRTSSNTSTDGIGSSLVAKDETTHNTSQLTDDPDPNFDDTTPLEVLSLLIENLSKHVQFAQQNMDYNKAQRYQREKIERLEERKAAYNISFDNVEAQETLAAIYLEQSNWVEVGRIYRELIRSLADTPQPAGETMSCPMEEPLEPGMLRRKSRFYQSLASSQLSCSAGSMLPDLLTESAKFAKRSVKLFRRTLRSPNEQNEGFADAVRLLVKILELQKKEVAAKTYKQLYLNELETAPPTPFRGTRSVHSVDDVNASDDNGITLLVLAIKTGQLERIHYLLRRGADVQIACENKAPLIHAIERNDPRIVRILKFYQPFLDLEAQDTEGRTALVIAAQRGDVEMIETLVDTGAKTEAATKGRVTPLMHAARQGHLSAVKVLTRKRSDCLAKDQHGWSTLHYAVHGSGGEPIIQHLLSCGIDIDVRCDANGETPLHVATRLYGRNAVRKATLNALVTNSANVNMPDASGNTPLSIAVEEEKEDLVKFLVENGAVNDRKIPSRLSQNIKKILKEAGPQPPRRHESGYTIRSMLSRRG